VISSHKLLPFETEVYYWLSYVRVLIQAILWFLLTVQGATIKPQSLQKNSFSVTVAIFTAFTEKYSGFLSSKFCYNICCGLKILKVYFSN